MLVLQNSLETIFHFHIVITNLFTIISVCNKHTAIGVVIEERVKVSKKIDDVQIYSRIYYQYEKLKQSSHYNYLPSSTE